jgi:hypothetical protein
MPNGTCKLCLEHRELCDSHYLPKRLYAFVRAKQMKNPNPLVLSGKGTKQVSDQLRGYVFCKGCEDLFNKNGEMWVLANIPHDDGRSFPLKDALGPEMPVAIWEGVKLYDVSSVAAFDMDKLVYFGLSIFWRGAAHDWKSTCWRSAPKVDLGEYFEPLRLFLLREAPIPDDVVLSVYLWPDTKVVPAAFPVDPLHAGNWHSYWFYVPGIFFILHLGKDMPEEARQRSAHGKKKIINVDLEIGSFIRKIVKDQVEPLETTDRMKALLREVSQIRSKISPKQ